MLKVKQFAAIGNEYDPYDNEFSNNLIQLRSIAVSKNEFYYFENLAPAKLIITDITQNYIHVFPRKAVFIRITEKARTSLQRGDMFNYVSSKCAAVSLAEIYAALTNRQGTDFIRWGEKFCEVKISRYNVDRARVAG